VRAVILAAGSGSRLRPVIGPWPKCLVSIDGRPLIQWQMTHLRAHAVTPITLVLGYRRETIEEVCGRDVEVVYNPDYATTNSLYSLWLARNLLREGFVVLNSDVLFHPHLLTRLLTSSHEDALLMAPRGPSVRYSDEEMKIHVRAGCVAAIDKKLPDAVSDGENVGIVKFGAEGAAVLLREAQALIAQGAVRDWLPRAFHAFAQKRPLHVIETGDLPWIEIDFPGDYARACAEVLPAIHASAIVTAGSARAAADGVPATFWRIFHRV
jgi:choline kinase